MRRISTDVKRQAAGRWKQLWPELPTPTSKIHQPEAGLFFAVLHRHGERWWIAALRERSSATSSLRSYQCKPLPLHSDWSVSPRLLAVPIYAKVRISLGLPHRRMAQAEKQLRGGLLKVVVAAEIEHRRVPPLRRDRPFRPVVPDLSP